MKVLVNINVYIYISYFRNTWRSSVGRNFKISGFLMLYSVDVPSTTWNFLVTQCADVYLSLINLNLNTLQHRNRFSSRWYQNFFQSCGMIITILLFYRPYKCFSLTGQWHLTRTDISNLEETSLFSTQQSEKKYLLRCPNFATLLSCC